MSFTPSFRDSPNGLSTSSREPGFNEPASLLYTPSVSPPSHHGTQAHPSPLTPLRRPAPAPAPPSSPLSSRATSFIEPDDSRRDGYAKTTSLSVLIRLLKRTGMWVFTGVAMMLFGIAVAEKAILPRIHTCPSTATCPGSFDPNNGNATQLLQSFMGYWLQAGVMISTIGIIRLTAYQAWFILVHSWNTLDNLELTIGAIKGSVFDACYLLFRKRNRMLALFAFALFGISVGISLITGLSIGRVTSTEYVTFQYNATSDLPNNQLKYLNNDGQLKAMERVISWALNGDQNHGKRENLRGTLIVPDARSAQAVNAVPGGPKINGSFTCQGWENYTAVSDKRWDIHFGVSDYIALSEMALAVALWRIDTATAKYVWVSNTTGLIQNATATKDGKMNIALCTHFLEMIPQEAETPGVEYLRPTKAATHGCDSSDSNVCVADSVNNAILNWWGGSGTGLWRLSCRGGVLGPVPVRSADETFCPMTQDLWIETATAMLDGIMETAPTDAPTVQDLSAAIDGLDKTRWWLNALIPAAIVIVYIIELIYTCILSRGYKALKELNLNEVVRAAQTEHVRGLLTTKEWKSTPIRYDSDIGFTTKSDLE